MNRACLVVVVGIVGLAASRVDASESASQLGPLANIFVAEREPAQRWVGAIGLAWEPLTFAAATYQLGYGWGRHSDGIFGSTDLMHVSLVGHVGLRPDSDTDVHGAVGAQFGAVANGLNTYGLSGGVQLEIGDDLDAGPVVSGRLGILHLTIRASVWLGLRHGAEVGGLVGVELFGTR